MIVLNILAARKEVMVWRGQLVEIGGSFRLPEVMAAPGVRLVEVGTANKTHPADYEKAITENTAAILLVRPSKCRMYGFTAEVPLADLAQAATALGIDHARTAKMLDLPVQRQRLVRVPPCSFIAMPGSVRGRSCQITSGRPAGKCPVQVPARPDPQVCHTAAGPLRPRRSDTGGRSHAVSEAGQGRRSAA